MVDTYTWEYQGETQREIEDSALAGANISIETIVDRLREESYNQALNGLNEEAQRQGLNINIVGVSSDAGYTIRTRWRYSVTLRDETGAPTGIQELESDTEPDLTGIEGAYLLASRLFYKVWVRATVTFTSDQILVGSPIAPIIVAIIAKVITAIVVVVIAYFAIQAVSTWLNSMVTTHSVITKTVQTPVLDQTGTPVLDGNGNPIYTTTTTIEDVTTPDPAGELIAVLPLIIGIIVVAVFAFLFFGGRGGGTSIVTGRRQ